jgi:two-component system chemotaxis sensor kinase CheA
VEVATDGVDGLRKIADCRADFDLIISDIEMPKMNGFDFARKVRGVSALKNVPMIAFTTKSNPSDFKEARLAGFTTLLEKSKGKLLGTLVSECLSNHKRKSA